MGVTFHENPCNWDTHFHNMMDKANARLYIVRTCKYYLYTLEELLILFESLIMSMFRYDLRYGHAYGSEYLFKIDKFCKGSWKYGYTNKSIFMSD